MDKFNVWLASTPLGSAFKIFLGALLAGVLFTWTQNGEISFDAWQTWVIGGLAVALPVVINYLNPDDTRYGRVKGGTDE